MFSTTVVGNVQNWTSSKYLLLVAAMLVMLLINKLMSVSYASVLFLIMNFVITLSK